MDMTWLVFKFLRGLVIFSLLFIGQLSLVNFYRQRPSLTKNWKILQVARQKTTFLASAK
jgi:hypothetical protein